MSQNLQPDPQPSEARAESPRPASPADFGSTSQRAPFFAPPANPSVQAPPAGSHLRLIGIGVLAAIILGGGAWFGIATRSASGPPIAVVAATGEKQKTFSVSKVDADQKATDQFKQLLAGGGSAPGAAGTLNAVNGAALLAMAKNSPALADEIKSGRRVLYRVYLLDFLEEDGDHAELSVDGFGLGDVYLRNAGTEILIPLAPGVPAQMKLTATADGGGGVTVGFVSSLGEARTRILQVGEFEQWQVTVQ